MVSFWLTELYEVLDLRQLLDCKNRSVVTVTPSFGSGQKRSRGWVGGFPQTNLFRAWGPRLGRRLWLVGDSIFPGQSILATALGGQRVAQAVLSSALQGL